MQRPSVDVVVPFHGPSEALRGLLTTLGAVRLRPGDTLTVVDNRADASGEAPGVGQMRVLRAPERQSSYFARNRGAEAGSAEWLLFIDADVDPDPRLVDSYFEEPPRSGTAVLAGTVHDQHVSQDGREPFAVRYYAVRQPMGQHNTLHGGRWGYAQTANCAVRRSAFEQARGFDETVRSAGDADLCFRLKAAGWEIETRERALVVHRSRRTVRSVLAQRLRHGAGAAWLNHRYPGSIPRKNWIGLSVWTGRSVAGAIAALARRRREEALFACMEPLRVWAFELGRLLPNRVDDEGPTLCSGIGRQARLRQ